ncbi:MAG TPA: ATP-binding protein [Lentimicrobium sp.]|nr:ATP-binding protein [Lentimicrobium sp.]
MEKPLTDYAPAEKASNTEIELSYHALKNNPLVRQFQEAMPDLSMILNSKRQVVYANQNLIKFLDIEDYNLPLGQRLGNLLSCVNSEDEPNGCGTTKACRFCGVVNAIVESMDTSKPIVKEARISATIEDDEITSYDLKVKASPLEHEGEQYTIVCINDISDRKRRAFLETSYLSEMYGVAAELSNMVSSINKEELDSDNRTIVESAEKVNNEMITDLLAQKMLNEAEEGELKIQPAICNSVKVLKDLQEYFVKQEISRDKTFFIDPFSHSIRHQTDPEVIRRILCNILTNAFEAIGPQMIVKTAVRLNDKYIKYSIFSPVSLTEEAKHQIFQRSFSTKGSNRGLGTYTARLLTTKYLKGKVYFNSDTNGTTFFVELPLSLEV